MNHNEETSSEQNNRFGMIVTALLIVIIVALAGLWIVERGRRLRAEAALMSEKTAGQKRIQAMGDMLIRQMTQPPATQPTTRER